MKRKIETWRKIDPKAIAGTCSPAHIMYLLEDAKADILELHSKQALAPSARDVLAERTRQVEAEGWTPEHDGQWQNGELAQAGASYALFASWKDKWRRFGFPSSWPWQPEWWKPTTRRRDLVKAAALILAEIDRLDRQEEPK